MEDQRARAAFRRCPGRGRTTSSREAILSAPGFRPVVRILDKKGNRFERFLWRWIG